MDERSRPCQGPHCLCTVDLAIARRDLARSVEAINAARPRLHEKFDAATTALRVIRHHLNLALPSEQTGEEWETTVRVPLARLEAIDAAVASVLGEPVVTGEPMPELHGELPQGDYHRIAGAVAEAEARLRERQRKNQRGVRED